MKLTEILQTQKKNSDKRELILNAALKTFVKRGYNDTKVAEIAAEANVSEGTLYNYFSSKEDILLALFDEKWKKIIDEIKSKISVLDDPNDKLKAIFKIIINMIRKDKYLAEIFLIDMKQSNLFLNNYTINRVIEFINIIEEVLKEGKRKGIYKKNLDTRVAKMIIFGAAQGILMSWLLTESKVVKDRSFKFSLLSAAKTLKEIFKSGLYKK